MPPDFAGRVGFVAALEEHRDKKREVRYGPARFLVIVLKTALVGSQRRWGVGAGANGGRDGTALAAQMQAQGMRVVADDTWSDLLSRVLVARVEPHLGHGRITILDRYPIAEAALARPTADDPRVAERFEVYACGVELANGFGELTNPAEQRRRFALEMDEKARVYGERYPLDEEFLTALAQMPAASGIALGFDRLVMLATGAARIDDVIWVPVAS